ncbi:hypothetical protein HK57_00377 [Aspergillus ustus]|uniref:Uncharacterized protein n=1 Tax=Aspergillus ustus TaxID=40382 RepID=A0A0C1C431_ASPUT|nr:hypothetical protein HK57_00377 [Aspergillus ustus]
MSVDMDFLFPLDERGNPLAESSSRNWPHLETIALDSVAEYTPSGEWLFDYELESGDDEGFPDPATGDEIFESRVAGWPRTNFTFTTTSDAWGVIEGGHASTVSLPSTSRPLLSLRSDSVYRPDQRVADAWGFELDEMEVVDEGPRADYHLVVCSVTLDRARLDR